MEVLQFEKLLSASDKFERHIQYQDTFYLYVNIQGEPALLSSMTPALSIQVPEKWLSIAEDFKSRKNGSPPVLLICNEDEYIEDDEEDTTNATHSSTSEGYESSEEHEHSLPSPTHQKQRRRSMDKIRKSHEEIVLLPQSREKTWLNCLDQIVNSCPLLFQLSRGAQLIEKLITRIRAQAPEKDRSRPKERSQSISKSKASVYSHPLKFLQNHSGDDKSSPKKSPRGKKTDKNSAQNGSSSSSSRESIEKSDNSGFLGAISSPPRRSKSVNVRGVEAEEHETHFPSAEGGYKGTAKSKISKKGSGHKAEDSDLQSKLCIFTDFFVPKALSYF
uniref:Uncharacterized protein n=1 Tax=Ditylenchus dipsaci TaxID=166011 RepID=A0A915EPI2_9BILA